MFILLKIKITSLFTLNFIFKYIIKQNHEFMFKLLLNFVFMNILLKL